ncbi:MAG TPA: hypothetical protein VFE53_06365 [Mucilaginibacter sp.]|jgi:hypothetical protein|nr:hypothetical protein [Mucilaginibacter sp.]
MNTVQHLNDFVDRQLIQKLFVKFANKYGNLWTSRLGETGDWKGCEDDWLQELSVFTVRDAIAAFKQALIIYRDFPPTQGQIIELCLKESGVPDEQAVYSQLIRKNFSHPIVKIIYDKIGSWKLSNGKESEIVQKVKEFYLISLAEFQKSPEVHFEKLRIFTEEQKALPEPEKSKDFKPHISLKQRLADYQQKIEEAKLSCKGETYRHFDEELINPHNKKFDKTVYEDFKNYLLSIPEEKTLILPVKYIYQRTRFLTQQEAPDFLRQSGYNPNGNENERGKNSASPRGFNGPQKAYKNWTVD